MSDTLHDELGHSTLALSWQLDLDWYTFGRFAQLVVDRSLDTLGSTSWPCDKETFEGLFELTLATERGPNSRSALLDLSTVAGEGCVAWIWLAQGRAHLRVGARSVDELATGRAWVRERYPESVRADDRRIRMTFWSLGPHCARQILRQIEVPAWDEVAENYPAGVSRRLAGLMGSTFQPGLGGRLLLWHGEPGTGKTYALRALGWEWRAWCDLHYITDPESFFGASPTYMLDVLLNGEDDDGEGESVEGGRWQLLILEDTGELLAADAKERTGQGLSRLLNVVDGLIGQGLRVLVLVTTNETLRSLHPAVSRPGRCASQVEFTAFPADEAADWLAAHGAEPVRRAGTLATLFARSEGAELTERQTVGFAG